MKFDELIEILGTVGFIVLVISLSFGIVWVAFSILDPEDSYSHSVDRCYELEQLGVDTVMEEGDCFVKLRDGTLREVDKDLWLGIEDYLTSREIEALLEGDD